MDLTGAEDIKKRWQEYTEDLYKNDLHDQDNHNGVITDLEPEILECKVKWALESITTNKASGGDGIPVELFQILKDDAVKVLQLNIPANLENSAVAPGLENLNFHSNSKERQCPIMFKLVLEKAEEPEIKLPTSAGSSKKQENSRETSVSALLTMPKPLTVWITTKCGKF